MDDFYKDPPLATFKRPKELKKDMVVRARPGDELIKVSLKLI